MELEMEIGMGMEMEIAKSIAMEITFGMRVWLVRRGFVNVERCDHEGEHCRTRVRRHIRIAFATALLCLYSKRRWPRGVGMGMGWGWGWHPPL